MNKELQRISVKYKSKGMTADEKLTKKIREYFIKRPSKRLVLKLKDKKIAIEYMYGAKYLVKRKDKNGIKLLGVMLNVKDVVDIINLEKKPKLLRLFS